MKVLVTGGAGYIGSITVRALKEAGFEPIVYDNLSTGFREAVPKDVKFIFGDIRDGSLLGRVVKDAKVDAVMHFAAKLIAPESVRMPWDYYDVNVTGTLRVVEACRQANVGALVMSSSAAVYGNPLANPVKEEHPLNPVSPYGASKAFAEKIIREVFEAGGGPTRFVILRYFNVAGASPDLQGGQRSEGVSHLLRAAVDCALGRKDALRLFGTDYPTADGTCVRDFIHVSDLAEAHVRALNHVLAGGRSLTLNCGYGHGHSVLEVVRVMQKVSGVDFAIEKGPRREGDIVAISADTSLIKETLGWQPRYDDLELMCRTALEWERRMAASK